MGKTIEERLDELSDLEDGIGPIEEWRDCRNAIIAEWNAAVEAIEGLMCSHHCHCVVTADECRTCIWANTCTKRAGWLILTKMEGTDV